MATRKVSIHRTTTGGVSDFLDDEQFECIASMKLLSFLAGALLRYEEEGVELSPQVVLCQSIETISQSFPGGKFYVIGSGDFSAELGKRVLKECAALARNGWVVFVERVNATKVRYGVFSYLASPTSLSLRDMIGVDDQTFAVLIERTDRSNVRLSGSKGNVLDVAFSTAREETTSDDDAIAKFARSAAPAATGATLRYMTGLISRLLAESHGTILACADGPILSVPGMTDAVSLEPPIEVISVFEDFHTTGTADALMELQRMESLLSGLMQSDGIVVFNPLGEVSAYRVFYRPPPEKVTARQGVGRREWLKILSWGARRRQKVEAPSPAKPASVTGGARRRAFQGVSALVGSGLKGALFRSQDGLTIFVG